MPTLKWFGRKNSDKTLGQVKMRYIWSLYGLGGSFRFNDWIYNRIYDDPNLSADLKFKVDHIQRLQDEVKYDLGEEIKVLQSIPAEEWEA